MDTEALQEDGSTAGGPFSSQTWFSELLKGKPKAAGITIATLSLTRSTRSI